MPDSLFAHLPSSCEAVEEVTADCAGVALHRSVAWLASNLSSAEEAATVMLGIKTRNFSPLENVSLEELIRIISIGASKRSSISHS
jgi:hypothetical protein